MAMIKNKTLVCLTVMALLVFSAGCAPGLTSKQVHRRHYHTIQNNLWQIQDDIDAVFLLDKPSRLSSMPVR